MEACFLQTASAWADKLAGDVTGFYISIKSMGYGGMKTEQAIAEVFFTAFKSLGDDEKHAFFGKIVKDPELRDDLVDLALIEKAKKIKGKAVSAKEYFQKRKGQRVA